MNLLYTKSLTKAFGGLVAVSGVDFEVRRGEITGVIGPNGAGKTTLFNTITGMDLPTEGDIFFQEQTITGLQPYKVTRLGIARTFQNIRLFKDMTILENVMLGRHFQGTMRANTPSRFVNAFLGLVHIDREEREIYRHAMKWLEFFNLAGSISELARNLPYGKQRELEIARALATEPKLLFLDEPAAGMNPSETDALIETIEKIRKLGITIVLIEHDMKLVMNICDRITVLNYGKKIAEGTPREIRNNSEVVEAYLGKEDE